MHPTPSEPDSDAPRTRIVGSYDGEGAGDNDQPYQFGRRPRALTPYPFNTRRYARLLILRSHVRAIGESAEWPAAS